MVYKLVPINTEAESEEIGRINTNKLYPILMDKYEWGNLNTDVYLDETNIRMTMNFRNNFSRLAQKLIQDNEYGKAKKVLDYCVNEKKKKFQMLFLDFEFFCCKAKVQKQRELKKRFLVSGLTGSLWCCSLEEKKNSNYI